MNEQAYTDALIKAHETGDISQLKEFDKGDRLLGAKEASALLAMSEDWLYRNAHKLSFTRKLGRKVVRFSYQGIQKYLATRKVL